MSILRVGAGVVLVGIVPLAALGACGGDDTSSPGAADGSTPDTFVPPPPPNPGSDAGSDTGVPDADAGPSTTVTGYQILGELSFAFVAPYALAVDSKNHVFVSEQTDAPDTNTLYLASRSYASNVSPGHARILEFDDAGTYLGWIGKSSTDATKGFHAAAGGGTPSYGYDTGELNMVRGMAFDSADHLFVLDNWRIQELDATRAFVRWTGFGGGTYGWRTTGSPESYAGPTIGGFTWPSGLKIHGGKLWVGTWYWDYPGFANGDWNCVSALDLGTGLGVGWLGGAYDNATALQSTGYFATGGTKRPISGVAHTSAPGIFSTPRSFVWQGTKIYVVDDTHDPVLSVFDETGAIQPGTLAHLTGADEKPFAIAVDKFGNVIVSDMYSGSIRFFTTKLDANGEFTQAAEWKLDTPAVENVKYPILSDFAWDGSDNLYVAATTLNKVYKIRLTY